MGRTTGLNRRKASKRLQFRRRWPTDVAHLLPGEGMARSTGTTEYAEARRRFREIEAEYDRIVEEARLRAAMPASGIFSRSKRATVVTEPFQPILTDADAYRLAADFLARGRADVDRQAPPIDPEETQQLRIDLDNRAATLNHADDLKCQSWAGEIADNLLTRSALRSEHGSASRVLLIELVRRAMLQLVALEQRRLSGDFSTDGISAILVTPGEHAPTPSRSGITLGKLIEQYDGERISGEDITAKTKAKSRAALAIVRRYFGDDADIAGIDRDAFVAFRDVIACLPPNVTKKFGPEADLKAIARENAEHGGVALNRETQTTYLRLAGSLFEFAKERRHVASNEASDLRPKGKKTPPQARRRPFATDQLRTIFAAPIYTGCLDDERNYAKSGPNHPRRSRFWVPLIALFTGLRMEEIFQLTPAHIQTGRDGLPFLLISPDMQVKTDNAFREVPVHRELLRIGFITFVADRRRRGESVPLFDDVPAATDGYRSTNFSKRFATFLKSLGIKDDPRRTCFHSFRHNFRDGLRQPGANSDFVREAGGWATRETSDFYGDGTRAHLLRGLIDGIDYDLDLRHLYQAEMLEEPHTGD